MGGGEGEIVEGLENDERKKVSFDVRSRRENRSISRSALRYAFCVTHGFYASFPCGFVRPSERAFSAILASSASERDIKKNKVRKKEIEKDRERDGRGINRAVWYSLGVTED